jgi:hypothetical protein
MMILEFPASMSLKISEKILYIAGMCILIAGTTTATLDPSIRGMQGGQFLRPLSDAVKPIRRQKISKANAYPARVGYSLQTEGRARVKEG